MQEYIQKLKRYNFIVLAMTQIVTIIFVRYPYYGQK